MRVALHQLDTVWHDRPANVAKARKRIANSDADLHVLPEMFDVGFSMDTAATMAGEPVDIAALAPGSAVLAGVVDPAGPGNVAVLAEGGRELGRYTKCRPFPLCGVGGEGEHYPAGDAVMVFDLHGFRLCPLICYDLRHPELWRDGMRQRATAFACLANWPASRREHWLTLLRARAIENQAYVLGVNRCGHDPNVPYSGDSVIYDPLGHELARAGHAEQTITATLDPAHVEKVRADFPFLP